MVYVRVARERKRLLVSGYFDLTLQFRKYKSNSSYRTLFLCGKVIFRFTCREYLRKKKK